ncbi:hypothetical protein BCV71DRAFT_241689 [Rhizopus microsporus]|uniref:HECT-type E3 ubiquitin transferase n=1 Tax=Rhizopus microsporus TaxID=58291 RepID=A0A1X0SAT8_RHIZD|nr:hypothetical protein BCV71DRAFT_241689 [Rhizopus microsporus]
MLTLNLQFYRTSDNNNTEEGLETINYVFTDQDFEKDDIDLFIQFVNEYNIPKENHFDLANRIRIIKHVKNFEERQTLLAIRILSIAIMAHGVSENTAQNKIFIYEPYLVSQLIDLISPEKNIDLEIQTFVFYALDAITRHRNKLSEILTAINASANHGILMQILRRVSANEEYSPSFLEAMLSFIACLLQTQHGGQMLISAVGNHQISQLKGVAKVVGLLDTIVNSFNNSFTAFCNAGGLDTLLEKIKLEVETACSYHSTEQTNIPHDRLSVIKNMLKFLLRMMESSGTAEGLRNLIDSSLPHSLKLIMDNPKSFGNSIFALAINVSTTLIHSEPTSLPILQEVKLPQSFLRTISTYETPNSEVLMAAVNAFGAICLNAPGLDMFNQEKPLPHFFELMTSSEFLKTPIDIDCATTLGSTMDELVRHHPSLKPAVFECVTTMVKKVLEMGSDMNGPGAANDNSHLIQTRSTSAMETDTTTEEDDKAGKFECLLVSFIDMVSRFLEGLFQNTSNIKEFVEKGCPEMLLDYYSLPLLPANFSVTLGSDSLAYIFRMISEVSPLPTMMAIVTKIKESIGSLLDQDIARRKSMMVEYVDVYENEQDKIDSGNKLLRSLIQTHAYVNLLSNLCCCSVFSHGKNGVSLVTEFLNESENENVIQLLGRLHRVMVWETLLFKEALPPAWYAYKHPTPNNPALKKNVMNNSEHPLGIYSSTTDSDPEENGNEANATSGTTTTSESVPSGKDPRMLNIKHFKTMLNEISKSVLPIFQVAIKVSVSRRAAGPLQKPQTLKLSKNLAELIKEDIEKLNTTECDMPCKYDYLTSIYTMTSLLLRDERSQSSLQTPIALALDKQNGIDLLLENLKYLWNTVVQLHNEDHDKHRKIVKRINNTIESLLAVLLQISSPKALRDSSCTSFLVNKDKKANDYFDPLEWIVGVELKMIPLKEYLISSDCYLFSKTIIQTLIKIFLQVMKGEGDFLTHTVATRGGDPFSSFTAPLMTSPFTLLRTPAVASEQNIQTLVEMGFERRAAEQALTRCNNQVSRAVDYLFSHPATMLGQTENTSRGAIPSTSPPREASGEGTEETSHDAEQQAEEPHGSSETPALEDTDEEEDNEEENMASHDEDEHSDMDEDMDHSVDLSMSIFESRPTEASAESSSSTNNNSENTSNLKQARRDLCDSLPPYLLSLTDQREDVIFDARDLLVALGKHDDKPKGTTAAVTDASIKILTLLLDRIEEVSKDASKSNFLNHRLRLLALLLREPPMQSIMYKLPERFSFMFDMLDFAEDDQLPDWVATLFLVLEAFIAQAEEPKKEKLNLPSQDSPSDSEDSINDHDDEDTSSKNNLHTTEEGRATIQHISSEHCNKLLQCCVALLKRSNLSRDNIYSVFRMTVRLTRNQEYARAFVELDGISLLFSRPKKSLEGIQGQQAFIILILRHVIESQPVLRRTMKDTIVNWFINPRPRNMDVSSFVRTNAHVVLRDPSTFVEVTTDTCRMTRYDEYDIDRTIKLKKREEGVKPDISEEEKKSSETVIYYLLTEIMTTRAEAIVNSKKDRTAEEKDKEDSISFVYIGFLLQCLVELISSYTSCKHDVLNFCKKQNGHPRTPGVKHRSFVSMLINDLLPYNHINPYAEESRKQQALSTWTASTLVAMCCDTTPISEMSAQQKSELYQVRKYVLEAVVRSLKDAIASNDPASVKYSKYLVLSDLCHRILNARLNIGSSLPRSINAESSNNELSKEDAAMSNSRIMLDKNFVAVLTSAVNDVDVSYPHSKTILNAMLRPLELLTRLAINADDTEDASGDSNKDDADRMDTAEESLQLPASQGDENEGAPDLYRNSALGMYGNVMEEEEYGSEDYSDVFGSSVEEEEEFDEESESDLSDMSEGEDEGDGDEEMEAIIHGYDEDEMDEDDDSDDIDAEAELIDDEDEDDGNREMTWHLEDIEEDSSIIRGGSVNADEREDQSPGIRAADIPYDEEEDELDALSDFEDASENLDAESEADLISDGMVLDADDLDPPFLNTEENDEFEEGDEYGGAPRTIIPIGFRRRLPNARRALIEGVGRTMRTPANINGQEDVITHPLLSNNPTTQTVSGGSTLRAALNDPLPRRGHGTGFSNWQEFEEMIGGNAIRMLESLLTNVPSGNQGSHVRVDVSNGPGGVFRSFEFDRPPNAQNLQEGAANGPSNDHIQKGIAILQDFQPMTSNDRWNQEARMMFGSNLSEKALKVVNSILNILVPIAIEDGKIARAEEEKRRQEQRRKEEEERRKAEEEKWRLEKEARQAALEAATQQQEHSEEVQEEQAGANTQETEASSSAMDVTTTEGEPADANTEERTIVVVHGEPVDISGTGIDVEFLEALPDDLREEVINQQIRNHPQTNLQPEDDSISPEFLDALPPEIREEVLHQEAIERERRDRQNRQTTQAAADSSNVVNIPSSSAADDALVSRRRYSSENQNDERTSSKKKAKHRRRDAAAQLIDKPQLATLVRLLFIPQSISKSLLNRLLLNLCENSKTRSDLLSYLVCVLYDGNTDLASVDNSFAALSTGKASKNPQKTTKTSASPNAENVPNYVIQRCLEALSHIISCNEQSLAYFLTESESLAGLKRSSSIRKGKSKEKAPNSWNKYPILVLMSLLDRAVFINNSSLMEQLMELLSVMCRPFPVLVKKYQEKLENKQKDPTLDEKSMPKPPTILDSYLKLIVHVLTNGECSSKTFQYTLNAISHLSALEGAQQTIVNELIADAKKSGAQILKDLANLVEVLENAMPGTEISSNVLAPFSASTSYQAKLLRVLKTIDYMFSRKLSNKDKTTNEELVAKNEKQMLQIYEELDFLPLWQTLGNCLSVVREKEDLINVATVLLPLIESFIIVSKCTAEKGQGNHEYSNAATAPETGSTDSFFFAFTEKHKKVLNIMVRNNPALMSGSFALLVRNPKMLEFDNKRNYFFQQLHKRTGPRETYPQLQLNVRRQYVFEDSYHHFQIRTGDEIKYGKLAVSFYHEEGLDAGGLTREWFSVLARQMFDPNYALFITSAADKLTYQPNRASAVNPDHLSYFKFVGRVIGKAIYDGRLLDAYFTRSFYKHILGRPVDYRDVEAIDPEYYKSLVWMLENDITDIIDLTFSIEIDYFGTKETIDLKPNGRNIPVTEANKHEYVALVTEQKLTTAIKDQINAFVQGFHEIIPASLIQIFNEQELELLISGLPDIDIDDWKNNTIYEGYTAASPVVQWFWRAVRSFDQEERAKLLQFATGTSKVPLEGFAHLQGSNGIQKFQIHKDFGGENRLPSAHTCFNQIDLPEYDSYESLRANLFKAISECSTGFAFA